MKNKLIGVLYLIVIIAIPGWLIASSAIDYTQNSSPVTTDEMLGIDAPAGTWSMNRFPLSAIIALMISDTYSSHTGTELDSLMLDLDTDGDGDTSDEIWNSIVRASDCSTYSVGCCVDTDDGKLYCYDGVDSMDEVGAGGDTNTQMFEGATRTALTQDDTTPTVTSGGLYDTNATGAMTITDFNDGDDHGDFSTGDFFGLYMDSSNVTIDFSTNSNIEGNANVDFTGSSSQVVLLIFVYESGDNNWACVNMHAGMSSPTEIAIDAIPLKEVIDTSSVTYTKAELEGTVLSNSGATGSITNDCPARTAGWNFTYVIEADYDVIVEPNDAANEQWYFNNTQMATDEGVKYTAADGDVGAILSCISTTAGVYCKSSDTGWDEETP